MSNPKTRNTTSPEIPLGETHGVFRATSRWLSGFDIIFFTQTYPSIVESKQPLSYLHKGVAVAEIGRPMTSCSGRTPCIFGSETTRPQPVRSDGQTDGLRTTPSYYVVVGKIVRTNEAKEAPKRVNEGASFGRTGTSAVSCPLGVL